MNVEADKKAAELKKAVEIKAKDLEEKAKEVIGDELKSKLGGKLKGLKKKDGD